MRRPRIAVPEIDQDMTNYTRALFAAGMDPVVISVQMEQLKLKVLQEYLDYSEFRVENYDGLLIPGGGDINPARYGQKLNGSFMILDALDDLQFNILDAFVKAKKPVLGICRGCQIINVYFGGSLIQHLPTAFRHSHELDEDDRIHGCLAEKGSWISSLYGTEFTHNSSHHQAAQRLGEGLAVDAVCQEDGVIETLHHTLLPVYGVQWHPERLCLAHKWENAVNGLPVFCFFSRLCGGSPPEPQPETRHHYSI